MSTDVDQTVRKTQSLQNAATSLSPSRSRQISLHAECKVERRGKQMQRDL